jgi:hypothetical protein
LSGTTATRSTAQYCAAAGVTAATHTRYVRGTQSSSLLVRRTARVGASKVPVAGTATHVCSATVATPASSARTRTSTSASLST